VDVSPAEAVVVPIAVSEAVPPAVSMAVATAEPDVSPPPLNRRRSSSTSTRSE
jgi:hypothetical protein